MCKVKQNAQGTHLAGVLSPNDHFLHLNLFGMHCTGEKIEDQQNHPVARAKAAIKAPPSARFE
jgi:hypothetical protein